MKTFYASPIPILMVPFAACVASADIIPAERKAGGTGWAGNVGVPGEIPTNRTVYTTIPAGTSAATIQAALNACPSNQIVQLSPGTYNLSATLQLGNNGVTLMGLGVSNTILNSSGGDEPVVTFQDTFDLKIGKVLSKTFESYTV